MKKQVCMLGLCVAGIASLALSRGGDAPEPPIRATQDYGQATTAPPTDEEAWVVSGLGMRCASVPDELATHLGLATGEGLLVMAVRPGSHAAQAGLEPYDVILSVDGERARIDRMERALERVGGLALLVVRAGVERSVSIRTGEHAGAETAFLSTDTLGPDHPFRRVGQIEVLRASYAEEAERYSLLMAELDQQSRQAKAEAKQAMATLQEDCLARVAAVLEAGQEELLQLVDERLGAERVAPLGELGIEIGRILPEERMSAVGVALGELAGALQATGERVPLRADEQAGDAANRARQRFVQLGNETANLLRERAARAWTAAQQEVQQHRERLGPKHAQRMEWTANTVEAIRVKVRDRITCAIDRAQEQLARKLHERLRKLDVPAPGEVEAALADLNAQLERMAQRFVDRTERALDLYEEARGDRNGVFVPSVAAHLAAGERAAADLKATIDLRLERALAAELDVDGPWQARARLDAVIDELGVELRRAVNDGRDGVRAGSVGLIQDLREERIVSDDAWKDLRQLLQRILSEASSDCWKLDGPHLDGRFPRRPAREAAGDVALVTR